MSSERKSLSSSPSSSSTRRRSVHLLLPKTLCTLSVLCAVLLFLFCTWILSCSLTATETLMYTTTATTAASAAATIRTVGTAAAAREIKLAAAAASAVAEEEDRNSSSSSSSSNTDDKRSRKLLQQQQRWWWWQEFWNQTYVINLASRTEKWQAMRRELVRVGLADEDTVDSLRFEAVNGHALMRTPEDAAALIRSGQISTPDLHNGGITAGYYGNYLSFRKLFEHALSQGYDRILVLEDDVTFVPDFEKQFKRIEHKRNILAQYDFVSLVLSRLNPDHAFRRVAPHVREIVGHENGAIFGAIATVFNRQTMLHFVHAGFPMRYQTDVLLGLLTNGGRGRLKNPFQHMQDPITYYGRKLRACSIYLPELASVSYEISDTESQKLTQEQIMAAYERDVASQCEKK